MSRAVRLSIQITLALATVVIAFLVAACFIAFSQTVPQLGAPSRADFIYTPMLPLTQAISGGAPAGCSQATAFIARESGSQTNNAPITTLICGMVTDGTFSLLDGLYIFATDSTTDAKLNLISASFTGTITPTLTFTPNVGWAGDDVSGFLDTGFNPSTATTPHYTQNSASYGAYVLTSRADSNSFMDFGASNTTFTAFTFLNIFSAAGTMQYNLNSAGADTFATANAQGSWLSNRTAAAAAALFHNGASVVTTTDATTANIDEDLFVFAANFDGAPTGSQDQLSAAWWGAGMTPTQALAVQSRLNAYMTTLGINKY